MKKLATIVSWVFNPLILPIYGLVLVMFLPSDHLFFDPYCIYLIPGESKYAILKMFFFFCVAAPATLFYWLYKSKYISSLEMDTKKERNVPIALMFIFCLMLFLLVNYFGGRASVLPRYIFSLPLSGVVVSAIFFFLNRWRKISLHSASAGILVGFILAFVIHHSDFKMWMLALSFIIAGLVMSARLFLNKHTLNEVLIGWVLGTFLTFVTVYLY